MNQDNIIAQVTLLGIYKRKSDESLDDVMEILIETGMYPDGKSQALEVFETLRQQNYLTDDGLSMMGVVEAQKAEAMFKQ